MNPVSHLEIRETFLEFFARHSHLQIASSSLIPDNDPTLLFVNSGMAPLKPYFTGERMPPQPRLCDVQKCVRTNDIESVGDPHHLTFFEMMGNWSIGDYFKEYAINLAWTLIHEVFAFNTECLCATVYGGDQKFPEVPPDIESRSIWEKLIPSTRIVSLGAESNFWGPTSDTGPCGPCTEVFIDRGPNTGCGKTTCGPDCSCGRFIEIWNAGVFMQYSLNEDGSLTELPLRSVDAGAGLDRFAMILQGAESIYDTDIFAPLLGVITSGTNFTSQSNSVRVIADHVRCATFMIADGVRPSNTRREYVLRRLLRRALLHTRLLEIDAECLIETALATIGAMSSLYPELKRSENVVREVMAIEFSNFSKAFARGLRELEKITSRSGNQISGEDAFRLHDTHGFHIDLLHEVTKERGLTVDDDGFRECLEEQRRRSRQ